MKARSFPRFDRSYEIVAEAVVERVWFGMYPSQNRISLSGCTIHTDNGIIRRNVRIAGNNNEMVCRDLLFAYDFPRALESAVAFVSRSNHPTTQQNPRVNYKEFFEACKTADFSTVDAYILQGGDVNEWRARKERNPHGYRIYRHSPLHAAAGWNKNSDERKKVVSALIAAGAVIDEKEEDHDQTPLGYACLLDRVEIAQILLNAGANPNHRPMPKDRLVQDDTPLAIAAARNSFQFIPLLVEYGADPNTEGAKNMTASGVGTPLQIAVYKGHKEAVVALLECGAAPNFEGASPHGRTPLAIAQEFQKTDLAAILARAGAV